MTVRSIALLLICGPSFAEDAAMVSNSEVIRIMQFESFRPMFEYCKSAVPEMEMEVSSEFASFHGKLDQAMKRFLGRIPAMESGSVPAAELEELRIHIAEDGRARVEGVKHYDPRVYCPKFLTNVRNTTVEGLESTIEQAYRRYLDRVKAKQQASQP